MYISIYMYSYISICSHICNSIYHLKYKNTYDLICKYKYI